MVGSDEVDAGAQFSFVVCFWTVTVGLWSLYVALVAVYRLYFSPLAHIPGPRLPALTRWYEAYYEIVLSGQYSFHIDKLHDLYGISSALSDWSQRDKGPLKLSNHAMKSGPIVRIAPDEVHVRDAAFYDEVYAKDLRIEKPGWDVKFGSPSSVFTTADASIHRRRRAVLNPMYYISLMSSSRNMLTETGSLAALSSL